MEWWKLFSGTFVLIFLAELGDKTQLAALAKTADSPNSSTAKWVVFLGASLALAASTFIAVFLGQALKSLVPDERYIKIAAGTLFLIFGFMILYETYRSYRSEKAPAAVAPENAEAAAPGLVGGLALRAAMDFESFAGSRYRRLAAEAPPKLAGLLRALAEEEGSHFHRLQGVAKAGASFSVPESAAETSLEQIAADLGGADAGTMTTVDELIRHEEATAEFYQHLADRALIPSVKSVFAGLAEEERSHARRLTLAARNMSGRLGGA